MIHGPRYRTPRLVGRDAEQAAARAEATLAAEGVFRCLLMVGEPGVGKTRLARELFSERVAGLSARAYPLGGSSEFGLWSEALDGYLRGRGAAEIRMDDTFRYGPAGGPGQVLVHPHLFRSALGQRRNVVEYQVG